MTRFCPRTTGSPRPRPLWIATHHQGLGAPGHHHPWGHQQHPMPSIPHMSTACTPLCPIPSYPGPSCPMDPQSVPLYTLKYPVPSCPPVPHTQPHIPHILLHPAPWTPRLCPYVPPNTCSAPYPLKPCSILHLCTPTPYSIQPYTLADPPPACAGALQDVPPTPLQTQLPDPSRSAQLPPFRVFQWHFPLYFWPEPPVFPEIAAGRGPGAAGGAGAAGREPRRWALRGSHMAFTHPKMGPRQLKGKWGN